MLNEEMKVDKEVKLKFENNKLLLTLTKVFNKMHEMVNMLIVNGTIHFGLSSSSNSELICVKIPNSCDPSISMELIGIKCQELNKAVTKFKKDFEITIKDTIKISSGSKALQIPIYETDYEFQDVNLPNALELTTSPLHFIDLIDICSFVGNSIKFNFKDGQIIGTSREGVKSATNTIISSTISKEVITGMATDKIKRCFDIFKEDPLVKLTTDTDCPMIIESVDMPYSVKFVIAPRVDND